MNQMPSSSSPSNEAITTLTETICAEHAKTDGALLIILNTMQDELGYIPKSSVPIIAKKLNLSRAEVHGVISFYHLYRDTPGGKNTVYVCCAEACQAMGARDLMQHASQHLGVEPHQTTSDNQFNLEPIYCLGNCACAPAVMINETLHAKVSTESFEKIIEEARES